MSVKCYFLEPLRQARLSLRRYSSSASGKPCPLVPGEYSYHNASTPLFDVPETFEYEEKAESKIYRHAGPSERSEVPTEYPWPESCGCGYQFEESDEWQVFSDHLYRRTDTGEILTIREAGPGAMWDAEWLADVCGYTGPDGRSLCVKCPNGATWGIDGRANNCTLPDDHEHKCWVRHGEPPVLTVDKNGKTCAAGAGSIQAGDYHGFLRNGVFEP